MDIEYSIHGSRIGYDDKDEMRGKCWTEDVGCAEKGEYPISNTEYSMIKGKRRREGKILTTKGAKERERDVGGVRGGEDRVSRSGKCIRVRGAFRCTDSDT